jgi:hypothetical protein
MPWVRRLDVLPECLHGVAGIAARRYRAADTNAGDGTDSMARRREQEEGAASDASAADPDDGIIHDDRIDLRQMSLYEQSDRVLALTAFYHQREPALMPFTAAVWDSLLEPKAPKVAFMAKTLGIGGSDRLALRKVLEAYLEATDAAIAALDDPLADSARETKTSVGLDVIKDHFERIGAVINAQAERWGRLINGEAMDQETAPPAAEVIRGPWLSGEVTRFENAP